VLVHELSHSSVAQKFKVEIESMTVFVFGGVKTLFRYLAQINLILGILKVCYGAGFR